MNFNRSNYILTSNPLFDSILFECMGLVSIWRVCDWVSLQGLPTTPTDRLLEMLNTPLASLRMPIAAKHAKITPCGMIRYIVKHEECFCSTEESGQRETPHTFQRHTTTVVLVWGRVTSGSGIRSVSCGLVATGLVYLEKSLFIRRNTYTYLF